VGHEREENARDDYKRLDFLLLKINLRRWSIYQLLTETKMREFQQRPEAKKMNPDKVMRSEGRRGSYPRRKNMK
jgi:hypothetical protein